MRSGFPLLACTGITMLLLTLAAAPFIVMGAQDIPAETHIPGKTLRSVVLLGRHGNRAPDPSVKVICPNRQPQSALYEAQNCGAGSMTRQGIRSIWDLGRATYRSYVEAGFVGASYKRTDVYVQASSSDRTLMSATAWGHTAFPEPNSNDFQVPVATYSVPMSQDDLLEVRKSRCLGRLEQDVKTFDENLGQKILKCPQFNEVIDKVSASCGTDLRKTPELTQGEFTLFDAIKDVSDAITGDYLEGFPRMQGLSNETALEFLTLAENLFQNRLYGNPSQAAYLSGKLPEKIQSIFERHVITRSQQLGLLAPAEGEKEDISAFGKLRAPRKLLAYHCHREVLYGIAKFLGFNNTVERPGLPSGLIHPGAGFFFELWEDDKVPTNTTGLSQIPIESRFYVRTLLWVPCWEGDNFSTKDKDGNIVCPMRVRVLPQCGQEFCPLPMFNEIIEANFQAAGGDFRKQCRVPVLSAEAVLRKQLRQVQGQIAAIEKQKSLIAKVETPAEALTARQRQQIARNALAKRLAANRVAHRSPHAKRRPRRVAKSAGSTVFLEDQLLEDAHDDKTGLSTDAQDQDISFTPLRDALSDMYAEHQELVEVAQAQADEDDATLAKLSSGVDKSHKHSQLTKEEKDAIAASVKEAIWEIKDSVLAALGTANPSVQAVAQNATTGAKSSASAVHDAAKSFGEEVVNQAQTIQVAANETLEAIKAKALKIHEQLKATAAYKHAAAQQAAHDHKKKAKSPSSSSATLNMKQQDPKADFADSVPPQAAEFLKQFMKNQQAAGGAPKDGGANGGAPDYAAQFQSPQKPGDDKQQQQFQVPDVIKFFQDFVGQAKETGAKAKDDIKTTGQELLNDFKTNSKETKDNMATQFKAQTEELKETVKTKSQQIRDSIKDAIAKQKAKAQASIGSSAHKTKE